MKPSELLQQMIDAGATPEACVIALRALEERDAVDNERRAKAAERKRRQRARKEDTSRDSHGTVTGQSRDPLSPHTPLSSDTLQKTPKGVQKVPVKIDTAALEPIFERVMAMLPPNARRRGAEANRFALHRVVARGAEPGEIEAAAKSWVEASDGKTETFVDWLDRGLWREWRPAKPPGTDWRGEVALFVKFGEWRPDGPRPGEPGCLAPPEILAEFDFKEAA